jgi:hypothetical protein
LTFRGIQPRACEDQGPIGVEIKTAHVQARQFAFDCKV